MGKLFGELFALALADSGLEPPTTILCARTVLLVVVQTLAAYRLGKADKFG